MKITLIDDNRDNRDALSRLLRLDGNEVETGSDANDVLGKSVNPPDALLVDYLLPGKDGVTLIKELRDHEQWNNTPIILITGDAGVQIPQGHLGRFCLLLKPVTLDQIYTAIATAKHLPRP